MVHALEQGTRARALQPRINNVRPVRRASSVIVKSYQGTPPPRRDGFWTGFALGGAIFGAAGFFFAPQISRAILNEQQKFKAPNWFEENKPPVTKQELEEKIDQLHAAINDVAAQVGPDNVDDQLGSNSAETIESVAKP